VKRYNFGELGLHRPYFGSAPLTREQIEKQMPIIRNVLKEYVEEMGITASFFERVFNTDPSEIDILRGDDSDKIVPDTDPTFDEVRTSLGARHYGLTTSEYRKRLSLRKSCGNRSSSDTDCDEATIWGLPPATYRSRSAKAEASCDYSDSEEQLLNAIPRRDRISHPIAIHRDNCWVSTMRGLPSWDETTPSPPQGGRGLPPGFRKAPCSEMTRGTTSGGDDEDRIGVHVLSSCQAVIIERRTSVRRSVLRLRRAIIYCRAADDA